MFNTKWEERGREERTQREEGRWRMEQKMHEMESEKHWTVAVYFCSDKRNEKQAQKNKPRHDGKFKKSGEQKQKKEERTSLLKATWLADV